MPKYLILYNSEQTAEEVMASASREQMDASRQEWMAWKDKAEKEHHLKMDWGLPLQPVSRVTPGGPVKSDNKAGGYAMIEAGSLDELLTALKDHPQLKRQGAHIDVLQLVPMPGVEA